MAQKQGGGRGKKKGKKGSVAPSQRPRAGGQTASKAAVQRTSKPSSSPPSRPSGIQIATSARPGDTEAQLPELDVRIPPPPPVGDIEESFFSQPQLPPVHDAAHEHDDVRVPHPKMTAAAHARRAHLSKYVKWTVACAGALCALALVRVSLSGKGLPASAAEPPRAAPVAPPAAEPKVEAPKVEAKIEPVAAPADIPPPPAAQAPQEAPAMPPAAAAPAAQAPVANDAPAAPAADAKTAAQEKKDAKTALERGRPGDAIAAGERSVALDPTDGEAWLVLGAAYQEKGKIADARRAFTSCLKQGKKGPIGECAAMLR